ncbi:MAG: tRNA pseudouridine(55) synthase TruB [Planctomycetes bacterium]|nr:tRNA pseudouridine(55) synthase TruB [Planctomycetota bacterium]
MPPTPLIGLIAIDKPSGATSRAVVDVVARAAGTKAVGHAGTLDPLACGVVIVCLGPATRLVDHLHELPKHYRATFLLGRSSPSDDLETALVVEDDPLRPAPAAIAAAARALEGDILQRPCDYSAVHVDGKRAYRLARKGRVLDLAPKPVRIDRLAISAYDWPRLDVDIVCSSGTFVRAIGRDLAAALGTTAVMEALERTAIGPFWRAAAVDPDAVTPTALVGLLQPALAAVPHLARLTVNRQDRDALALGRPITLPPEAPEALAAVDEEGLLVGILRALPGGGHRLRPSFIGRN